MKKRRQIAAAMALGMMLTAVPFTTGSADETKEYFVLVFRYVEINL